MATKAETKITRSIIEGIKSGGGDAYHVHGSTLQRGGEPDITGEIFYWWEWRHLKLEVKTDEGEPTERQLYRLKQYHKRGYVAGVVRSMEDVRELLRSYREWWIADENYSLADHNLPYGREIYRDTEDS